MKRILIILLTLSFVVSSILLSASAADLSLNNYFNVLDVATPNGSISNQVYFGTSGYTVEFDIPIQSTIYGIEAVVRIADTSVVAELVNSSGVSYGTFTKYGIGSNVYKLVLYDVGVGSDIWIRFNTIANNVTFLSLYAITGPKDTLAVSGAVTVTTPANSYSMNQSGAGVPLKCPLEPETDNPTVQEKGSQIFTSWIHCTSWRAFDYISVSFAVQCLSIDSIVVIFDGKSLPYEISSITSGLGFDDYNTENEDSIVGTLRHLYWVDIVIDCRGIRKDVQSQPSIGITGLISEWASDQYVSLSNIVGFLDTEMQNPLFFYLERMWESLKQIAGADDSSKSDEFDNEFQQQEEQMNDLIGDMESVTQPTLGNIDITNDPSLLNPTALTAITDWSKLLFNNSFFLRIFTVVMVLATGSYVLFGKR